MIQCSVCSKELKFLWQVEWGTSYECYKCNAPVHNKVVIINNEIFEVVNEEES